MCDSHVYTAHTMKRCSFISNSFEYIFLFFFSSRDLLVSYVCSSVSFTLPLVAIYSVTRRLSQPSLTLIHKITQSKFCWKCYSSHEHQCTVVILNAICFSNFHLIHRNTFLLLVYQSVAVSFPFLFFLSHSRRLCFIHFDLVREFILSLSLFFVNWFVETLIRWSLVARLSTWIQVTQWKWLCIRTRFALSTLCIHHESHHPLHRDVICCLTSVSKERCDGHTMRARWTLVLIFSRSLSSSLSVWCQTTDSRLTHYESAMMIIISWRRESATSPFALLFFLSLSLFRFGHLFDDRNYWNCGNTRSDAHTSSCVFCSLLPFSGALFPSHRQRVTLIVFH